MASSFNLLANPELDRILRINLPGRRLLFIGGFALALVLVVAAFSWNDYARHNYFNTADTIRLAGRQAHWALTVILFGLLFVLAPAMTALSFIQEKLRGTAIFQQMVLMKPLDIALGKFFGSGAASYFAAMIIMPFSILAALVSDEEIESVFALYLFLIIGGLSLQAIGLFISAAIASPAERSLRGGLLIGPAVGVMGAVTALFWYRYFTDYREQSYHFWRFYGMTVEGYVVILGLLIFMGLWAMAGAVRRIKASQLVPTSARPVWLFFATAEALLVGILWGWQPSKLYYNMADGTAPIVHLILYMMINWGALLALAGSSALSRNGLREWWSARGDPTGLFQRGEIRNSFKTFLIALGLSVAGLVVLWTSYHMDGAGFPQNMALYWLVPILFCFVFTIGGALCFIQYSAMQRFRTGAWAGVGLLLAFYLVAGVVGLLFEDRNNSAFLVNPIFFAQSVTRGDDLMSRISVKFNEQDETRVESYVRPNDAVIPDSNPIILRALLTEGLLALGFFSLAFLKWRRLEDEMLESERGSQSAATMN
jgi:hypothetical protein